MHKNQDVMVHVHNPLCRVMFDGHSETVSLFNQVPEVNQPLSGHGLEVFASVSI